MATNKPNKIPEIKTIKYIEIENFKSFKYKESIEINTLSLFPAFLQCHLLSHI